MERTKRDKGLTPVEGVLGASVLVVGLVIATPFVVKAREKGRARTCVVQLARIRDAKARWVRVYPGRKPREADLFGPGRYLPREPVCPSGGTYRVNDVGEKPTCSVGPNLDPYPHRWER